MDKQEKQKVYAILDWAKQQIEICLENKQKVENIYPGSIYFASLGIGIGVNKQRTGRYWLLSHTKLLLFVLSYL